MFRSFDATDEKNDSLYKLDKANNNHHTQSSTYISTCRMDG